LELSERGLELALLVEEVPEVDPRFMEVRVEPQRATQLPTRRAHPPEAVERVAERRVGIGAARVQLRGLHEDAARLLEETGPVERAPHREEQIEVIRAGSPPHPLEELERFLLATQSQQHLAEPDQSILMIGLERGRRRARL